MNRVRERRPHESVHWAIGCAKPKAPTLEPLSARATGGSQSSLEVTVQLKGRQRQFWRGRRPGQSFVLRGLAHFGDANSGMTVPFVVNEVLAVEEKVNFNPSTSGIK